MQGIAIWLYVRPQKTCTPGIPVREHTSGTPEWRRPHPEHLHGGTCTQKTCARMEHLCGSACAQKACEPTHVEHLPRTTVYPHACPEPTWQCVLTRKNCVTARTCAGESHVATT